MPVYRYMDWYPFHGNQAPFNQHYHQRVEAVPPHMKADPSKSAVIHEPWPYANNIGYTVPCHFCGSHGYFPGYYSFRLPCPHLQPTQFHYCYGQHPPFPEAHPVQYVPHPRCAMEQPRYEYDMDVPRDHHCCGCLNHMHNQKNDNSVKIEERDPAVESKSTDSLAPFQLKNYPYPIAWIPTEYTNNKEHRKPLETQMESEEKFSPDKKHPAIVKPSEQEPSKQNSRFPLDMNSLESLMQGAYGKRAPNYPNEDKIGQFPFPIFWMPSYNKQVESDKEEHEKINAASKAVEELPSAVKIVPVKLPDGGDGMQKPQVIQQNSGSQVSADMNKKDDNQKGIPLKQMEALKEKQNSEDTERRARDISMKNAEESMMGKGLGTTAKRQSASPPKTSKLPRVCLRVDPLPSNKNGNTNSRSPSPPGSKGQSEDTLKPSALSNLIAKTPQDSKIQDGPLHSRKEMDVKKNEGKFTKVVVERKTSEDKEGISGFQTQIPVTLPIDSQKEASGVPTTEKTGNDGGNCTMREDEGSRDAGNWTTEAAIETKEAIDGAASAGAEPKAVRKKLSDEEAALLIQSAYRGFEVRKWEPLKKLKQIAKVQEQVIEVRNQIHALEFSSDIQKDNRQRTVIGEMIMNLLLKLDAIQGLQPCLREIRKSLARELVNLQEKLDLLAKRSEEIAKPKSSEDSSVDPRNVIRVQQRQNREAGEQTKHGLTQMMDAVHDTQGEETSKPLLAVEDEHGKSDVAQPEGEVGNGEFNSREMVMTEKEEEKLAPSLQQEIQLPLEKNDSEEIRETPLEGTCCGQDREEPMHMDNNVEVNKLKELLQGVIYEETVAPSEEKEQSGTGMTAVAHNGDVRPNLSIDTTSSAVAVEDLTNAEKVPEMNPLTGLYASINSTSPAEDMPTAEKVPEMALTELYKKHEKSEMQETEVLHGGDVEHKAEIDPSSPEKKVQILSESEQQPMEMLIAELRVAESKDSGKVVSHNYDDNPGTMLQEDVQQPQALEVSNDNEHVEVFGKEEIHVFSEMQKESCDEVLEGAAGVQGFVDVDYSPTCERADTMITSQEKEAQNEDGKHKKFQPTADHGSEEMTEEKQYQEQEVVSCSDKMVDHPYVSDTVEESLVGPQFIAMCVDPGKEETESLSASSAASQLSMYEKDMRIDSNRKLIEENEKLREMMDKLIELGKEQFTVMSNLTGRVKKLEKKLARKKRPRPRQYKTMSLPSCARASNESVRKKAVGIAI